LDPPDSAGPVSRGVGPSVVGQMLRDRSLRLAAGLAIAVAIPVAVLFYFQFRSIEDLGRSSTVVLEQLDLPFIKTAFAEGFVAAPFIGRFYAWSDETKDHPGELLAFDRGSQEF